jgi:hypothetical protein
MLQLSFSFDCGGVEREVRMGGWEGMGVDVGEGRSMEGREEGWGEGGELWSMGAANGVPVARDSWSACEHSSGQ